MLVKYGFTYFSLTTRAGAGRLRVKFVYKHCLRLAFGAVYKVVRGHDEHYVKRQSLRHRVPSATVVPAPANPVSSSTSGRLERASVGTLRSMASMTRPKSLSEKKVSGISWL